MITTKTESKFFEWLTAEDMHNASKKWLSELRFIKDEQLFFEDLIRAKTLSLIDNVEFAMTKEIVDAVNRLQKENNSLIKDIEAHENALEIMIDGVNEIQKENLYKKTHRQLLSKVSAYLSNYKKVKTQLFDIITAVMKKEKQNRLLDKK